MAGKGKKTAKIVEPPLAKGGKGKLFGAPLTQDVPKIISASLLYLKENAANEEGLFRISGPQEEVQQLKEKWEIGKDIDLKKFSPHTVAGTMKLFLRELPEPLLSYQFYSAFITTDAITNNDSRIASVRKLLSLLPRTNCEILKHVMNHFHGMLEHKVKTKMTSANLAIIIAPNILRCRVESVHQIMRDAPHVQSVIRCMIDDFPSLFERPIEPAQRRRTIHDFTGNENRSETSLVSEPPAAAAVTATTSPTVARTPAAATTSAAPKEAFKLSLSPPANVSPVGLLSPRIQEITVEIAPSVPHELRLVLQRVADRFVDLRAALQKATNSSVLGAIMQIVDGQVIPEAHIIPAQMVVVLAADPLATEAQLLKDMLKHFFVTVHKRVASLARTAAKSEESCPPALALDRLLTTFFGPAPAAAEARSCITFVSLRTYAFIKILITNAIELGTPTKNHSTLLQSLCAQVSTLKGGAMENVEGKPLLEVLAELQAFVAERQRELLEDTILLSDEAGLKRLWAVSGTAVAMRRELVRALDQPMPDASFDAPTPKNESNLYSVRSNAMKLLHRIQHNQLPALKKELFHTTSEQRSMAIGQIVRSVKAALDQPDDRRDYLKEKVIADAGEPVAEEDRGRLQTLQEVIGFVFVAVEGALTNLHSDLDSAAYEATATSQLLTDIESFLALNLDPTAVVISPKVSKGLSNPMVVPPSESEQLLFLRRAAQQALEQLQEDLDELRGELESTQAVMLALAISKLGNVLKKIMNGEMVDDTQFVERPQEEAGAEGTDRDKLEALKKLTFLTFDKAQAFLFKQRSMLQGGKTEAEVSEVAAATSQLHRALEAFNK